MNDDQSSRTAGYMAFFRALESARPAQRRLFTDPFAVHFLRPALRRAVSWSKLPPGRLVVNAYADRRLPGARTSAIARTRMIDEALIEARQAGIGQVVILGAGFDCRPYRLPELASAIIFEVDHPSTLAVRSEVLRRILPEIPPNVHRVEIDFNRQSLPEVLRSAGFEPSRPAVFLWEGVSHYLTAAAVDAVLLSIAGCCAGTRILFTYIHSGVLDGSVPFEYAARVLRDMNRLGEPWIFGIAPEHAREFLLERGLCLDVDLSARAYRTRYFGAPGERMRGYDFYHVAIAHVPQPNRLPGLAGHASEAEEKHAES